MISKEQDGRSEREGSTPERLNCRLRELFYLIPVNSDAPEKSENWEGTEALNLEFPLDLSLDPAIIREINYELELTVRDFLRTKHINTRRRNSDILRKIVEETRKLLAFSTATGSAQDFLEYQIRRQFEEGKDPNQPITEIPLSWVLDSGNPISGGMFNLVRAPQIEQVGYGIALNEVNGLATWRKIPSAIKGVITFKIPSDHIIEERRSTLQKILFKWPAEYYHAYKQTLSPTNSLQ